MKAKAKLDYEYQIFYLDCMRQSKAGIYARSDEIQTKREIKIALNKIISGNKEVEKKVEEMDSVLEEVYRYVKDHEYERLPVQALVKRWIKSG